MAHPTSEGIPPALPPSVEEAYRRKCIQLKQRMIEVEAANDISRLRLVRMERAVQKMRLERAFLLEQLAERTSTNVEDSEGTPSPPPTPKEKPLRIKRGHRKPSFLNSLGDGRPASGSTFIQQGITLSPSSDVFPHNHIDSGALQGHVVTPSGQPSKRPLPTTTPTSGHPNNTLLPRLPYNAFELFCNETRSPLMMQFRDEITEGTYDIGQALAFAWSNLEPALKEQYESRCQEFRRTIPGANVASNIDAPTQTMVFDHQRRPSELDVSIVTTDEGAGVGEGGFTAINRNH